jgi:hypothetical protein
VSAIDRIAIRHVDVERATVISAQLFAAVVSKLAAAIGHPDMSAYDAGFAAPREKIPGEGREDGSPHRA